MGAEALVTVTVTDDAGPVTHPGVKALLESAELILRGPVRRRLAFTELEGTIARGGLLTFRAGGELYELLLDDRTAARWAARITTPPPGLAAKLGISAEAPPLVLGAVTDPELAAALAPFAATDGAPSSSRQLSIAEVDDHEHLAAALAEVPDGAALWVVHRKGSAALLGDAEVRATMRSAGWIDTKVCRVSDLRTATRYVRRATAAR